LGTRRSADLRFFKIKGIQSTSDGLIHVLERRSSSLRELWIGSFGGYLPDQDGWDFDSNRRHHSWAHDGTVEFLKRLSNLGLQLDALRLDSNNFHPDTKYTCRDINEIAAINSFLESGGLHDATAIENTECYE